MSPFCAKINLDISFTSAARKGAFMTEYTPIKYYRVLGNPFRADLLREWQPDSVRWVEITGAAAGPHRDHGTITALNCYFDAAGAVTSFWQPKENATPFSYPGSSTANLYRFSDLNRVDGFRASDGDAYLLNTSEIHSVYMDPTRVRRFIQLSWSKRTFEYVLDMITKTVTK